MHSQLARTEPASLNLAPLILLDPVQHMKDNILSFHMNPKYICIINKISHSQADGPFKPQPPRKMSYSQLTVIPRPLSQLLSL